MYQTTWPVVIGTHDNETVVGWWKDSAKDSEKEYIKRYLNTDGKDIAGDFMREAFKSTSKTSIVMLQVSSPSAYDTLCCWCQVSFLYGCSGGSLL